MPKPELEAERLLATYGPSPEAMGKVMDRLSAQFTTMQARSQLLLTLATITLTITGFSGPTIAHSNLVSRWALGIGLALVLGAILVLLSNLRIRWLSQFLTGDALQDLTAMIRHRNAKTRWYTVQIVLLGTGLASYVTAIIAFLLAAPY